MGHWNVFKNGKLIESHDADWDPKTYSIPGKKDNFKSNTPASNMPPPEKGAEQVKKDYDFKW